MADQRISGSSNTASLSSSSSQSSKPSTFGELSTASGPRPSINIHLNRFSKIIGKITSWIGISSKSRDRCHYEKTIATEEQKIWASLETIPDSEMQQSVKEKFAHLCVELQEDGDWVANTNSGRATLEEHGNAILDKLKKFSNEIREPGFQDLHRINSNRALALRTNLETLKSLRVSIPKNAESETLLTEINDSIKDCQTAIKSQDLNIIQKVFKDSNATIQALHSDPKVRKLGEKTSELKHKIKGEIKRLQELNLSIPEEEEAKLDTINQAIRKCQIALQSGNTELMEEVIQSLKVN